ncbi:MAG: glycosyltransferase family 9 protein [Chloroflexi bacterium]|nr:glycosyltransferase family 9 protein [Chloroflexota bacterium]
MATLKAPIRRSLLRALGRATRPLIGAPPSTIRRVLVVRPDHLGDLLLMTPALRLLRTALPDVQITCLVGPWGRPALRDNPNVAEILTWDFPWFNRQELPSFARRTRQLVELAQLLDSHEFDAALIMRFDFWWGALACHLAGIPVRIGYDTPETRPFLSRALPHPGRVHETDCDLALARALVGASALPDLSVERRLDFVISDADERAAQQLLAKHGVGEDEPVVALHPGAGAWPKFWTVEGFGAVGDALAERVGARVVITGSLDERCLADGVAREMRHEPIILVGKTGLGVLGAVYRRTRVVVGVDSGPMHLAAAVDAPSVHLYGPIDPQRFGPVGDPARHLVVRSEIECSPCDRLDWPGEEYEAHPCVRMIPPAQVLEAAGRAMSE